MKDEQWPGIGCFSLPCILLAFLGGLFWCFVMTLALKGCGG